jgi:hypothetical protein
MKLRTTTAGTGPGALLRVIGCGAMTVFASAAISACTSAPASTSSSNTAGTTQTTSAPVSLPENETTTPSTSTPSETATETSTPTPPPHVAPATGGGGTAGIQDATLFIIGGAAVLAGAGGIAYHRRATRNR